MYRIMRPKTEWFYRAPYPDRAWYQRCTFFTFRGMRVEWRPTRRFSPAKRTT
jgi:hypothetical protein